MDADSQLTKLADIFSRYGERRFLLFADGRERTYREFWADAEAMAARLSEEGVRPGERVLVSLENSEHVLRLYLAAAIAGVVICPTDPAAPPARLSQIASALKPRMTVTAKTLPALLTSPATAFTPPGLEDERDFLLIYSSGTTGEPKGILHSLSSLLASADSFARMCGMNENSIVYHHFPMFYNAGILNLFLCPLTAGATIVVGERFSHLSMLRFWEIPKKTGVNQLMLTPTMALSLSQLYRTDDELLNQLSRYESVVAIGSALYPTISKRFLDTFGIPLRACYGVTEMGGPLTLQSWEEAIGLETSVGQWAPRVKFNAGSGPEDAREILIRTPYMMKGYFTEGTLQSFTDKDGFFHSGDLGYFDEGKLFVTSRMNEAVKKGGEFVSLREVENQALGCRDIVDVAVVAVPDEYWGNRIVLFYVPRPNADGNSIKKELAAIFSHMLKDIEHPDKIIPVPWLPKTASGKTIKGDLIKTYTL